MSSKLKKYFKIAFIFGTVLTVVLVCATVFYCINKGKNIRVGAETEPYTVSSENTEQTETESFDNESKIVTETESDTEPMSDYEEKQLMLDKYSSEIADWIKNNTPIYMTEPETDESGTETKPAKKYTPHVSFYYADLTSGLEMKYDEDRVFFAASVIKEPYILWLIQNVEKNETAGGTDEKFREDREFVYTEDKFKEGSGVIQKSEFGTVYTYIDLMRLTITQSDNVAFAELRRVFGKKDFNKYMSDNGVVNPVKSLYTVSASDAAKYLKLTYEYFEGKTKYSEMLKKWMLSTNHRILIPSAVKPTQAANKYGWDRDSYHDTAIVFDENPYLLVILTELDKGSGADNRFICRLSEKINDIHKLVFYESK